MSLAAEVRDRLEPFDDKRRGLVVIDRRQHTITDCTPADLSTTRTTRTQGEREVVEFR